MENIMQEILKESYELIKQAIVEGKLEVTIYDSKGNKFEVRFRVPTLKEKTVAEKESNKLRIKLMKEEGYEFRETLIEMYKKKGIDIGEIDRQFNELQEKINNKYVALDKLREENEEKENKERIEQLKQEIQQLMAKQLLLSAKKSELLKYSIEDECENHFFTWLIIQCVDVKNDKGGWERIYKDFNDWENKEDDEEFRKQIIHYAGYLFFK